MGNKTASRLGPLFKGLAAVFVVLAGLTVALPGTAFAGNNQCTILPNGMQGSCSASITIGIPGGSSQAVAPGGGFTNSGRPGHYCGIPASIWDTMKAVPRGTLLDLGLTPTSPGSGYSYVYFPSLTLKKAGNSPCEAGVGYTYNSLPIFLVAANIQPPPPPQPIPTSYFSLSTNAMFGLQPHANHFSPGPKGYGYVNFPEWFWRGPDICTNSSAIPSVGAVVTQPFPGACNATIHNGTITVSAWIAESGVQWNFGDGSPGLECLYNSKTYTFGTPYNNSVPARDQHTACKYTYSQSSGNQRNVASTLSGPMPAYAVSSMSMWGGSYTISEPVCMSTLGGMSCPIVTTPPFTFSASQACNYLSALCATVNSLLPIREIESVNLG